MTLATQADVEAVLGRSLTDAETARAESALVRASALVLGYTRAEFDCPAPDAVIAVVADMAARVLTTSAAVPPGVEQHTQGPFTVRYASSASSGGPWLTAAEKIMLRPYRAGGGLTSVQMVGERYEIDEG